MLRQARWRRRGRRGGRDEGPVHVHFDEVEHAILSRQDNGDIPSWQAAAVEGKGAAPVECWVALVWESCIVF